MEKKNEIKKTAFSFCLMGLLALANLLIASRCETFGGILFNIVLAMVMAFFAAKDYANLQVLKADKTDKK